MHVFNPAKLLTKREQYAETKRDETRRALATVLPISCVPL